MRNLHTLLTGQTGSGKSTLAKALVMLSARVIVLDRQWEYNLPGARVVHSFAEAAAFLKSRRLGFFTLVVRPEEEEDYFRVMELAAHMQKNDFPRGEAWPLARRIPSQARNSCRGSRGMSGLARVPSRYEYPGRRRLTRRSRPADQDLRSVDEDGESQYEPYENPPKKLVALTALLFTFKF